MKNPETIEFQCLSGHDVFRSPLLRLLGYGGHRQNASVMALLRRVKRGFGGPSYACHLERLYK